MTTMTRTFGLGLALLLAACSSGGSTHDNAAAGSSFTYGSAQPASSTEVGSMGATVASLDAFKASPSAATGLGAADGASVSGSLLKGGSIGSFSPGAIGATDPSAFDVPACATVTTGQVTFSGCRVTVNESDTTSTTKGSATVNGHVTVAADGKTLDWDLSYGVAVTMTSTGSAGTISLSADLHSAGHVVVTDTTAVGTMRQEVSMQISANGQSASAGVDESLAFDVTHAATCSSGVTGGTLEAKRVWTSRPSGATAASLPDEAVKLTWTGCGLATIQAGTH